MSDDYLYNRVEKIVEVMNDLSSLVKILCKKVKALEEKVKDKE